MTCHDHWRLAGEGKFATNLVPGDTNNARNVFVRDRQAGTTVRVSVDSAGMQATGQSFAPAVSREDA